MCTVSLVRRGNGLRLMCNRDEQFSRPPASPPELRVRHAVRSLWPRDPLSGGTWIGVNEAGLVACLLNRSGRAERRPRRVVSRGTIIPRLLGARSIERALPLATALRAADFAPFLLLLVQGETLARVANSRGGMQAEIDSIGDAMLFTSSSLGDDVALAPRAALFARMVASSPRPLAAQAAFHEHRWADRPEISVRMRRADAATVSRTIVDVTGPSIRLRYTPLC